MAANAVYCGGGCAPVHATLLDTGFTRRPVPLDGAYSAGSCRIHLRLIEILGGLSWRIVILPRRSGVQAGLKIAARKLEMGPLISQGFTLECWSLTNAIAIQPSPGGTDQGVAMDGFSPAFRSSTTANIGRYMNSTIHRPASM